jgi:hypothetical protein
VVSVLEAASQHSASRLSSKCVLYILKNYGAVEAACAGDTKPSLVERVVPCLRVLLGLGSTCGAVQRGRTSD